MNVGDLVVDKFTSDAPIAQGILLSGPVEDDSIPGGATLALVQWIGWGDPEWYDCQYLKVISKVSEV